MDIEALLLEACIPQELHEFCIVVDDLIFAPQITYGRIVKTAEEVYQEWLADKDKPPVVEPSTEDKMEVRLNQIEEAIGIIATEQAKNILLNGVK